MAVLERHPTVPESEAYQRLDQAFGTTGYGEYSDAPWAVVTQASFPAWMWPGVWYSWLSVKGHLQSFYDLNADYCLASREGDNILGMWALVFGDKTALEEFMVSGYTLSKMLTAMGIDEADIHVSLHREFS